MTRERLQEELLELAFQEKLTCLFVTHSARGSGLSRRSGDCYGHKSGANNGRNSIRLSLDRAVVVRANTSEAQSGESSKRLLRPEITDPQASGEGGS